jgi:DNA recombination protein RmuC
LEIILVVIAALTLLLVGVLLVRSGRDKSQLEAAARLEAEIASLRQELGAGLQQTSIGLTGIITKSGADMRQEVADRIGAGLADIGGRVESSLAKGREETSATMNNTTESVIKRLNEFGERNETRIVALEKKTAESLDAIREKVNERLMAIGQQVQTKLDENIKEGFAHFEKVQEHLKKAEAQLMGVSAVGNSINELNNLLKLPHLRGGFGEAALEMMVSDTLPPDLYEMQVPVGKGLSERVDVLVKLPGASLPIDAKFPREQVLPLFETSSEADLAEARRMLRKTIREQAKDISTKYIRPEHGTTDMALMFLPSETLYFEVVRDGELWSSLARMKVYPVSPNTLAVTLKGVSLAYEYYRMAKSVEGTIEDIKKAQRHFALFSERFQDAGRQLDRARDAFGKANTHLGNYSSSVFRLTGEEPPKTEEDTDQTP